MKAKSNKTAYWVATIIFSAFMLMDAIGGITRAQAGVDVLNHLGYPVYLLTIVGVAKLLGVVAILQTRYTTIKEWAFAGFAFNFIGGAASRAFVGDSIGEVIFPIIMFGVLLIPYMLWKKSDRMRAERLSLSF